MTPVIELAPPVVEEIIDRAARPDFDRWSEQLQHCGHCSRPVRLRGRVIHQSATGRRSAYSTDAGCSPDDEPEAVAVSKASVPLPFPLYAIDSRCIWYGLARSACPHP